MTAVPKKAASIAQIHTFVGDIVNKAKRSAVKILCFNINDV
jgi:predicted unusual protein kinase regulating ubiquinone biosynthesis (AarF/ABC1/UbiB family)